MQDIFLKVVSTGMNAGWMILAVLLLRVLFRKSSKWIACFLWVLVGIRLICPYDIQSTVSLVPIRIEVPFADSEGNIVENEKDITSIHIDRNPFTNRNTNLASHIFQPGYSGKGQGNGSTDNNKKQIALNRTAIGTLSLIWLCGVFVLFSYFIISCIYMHNKNKTATHLTENIWESEFTASPYIFGWIRPKIYVPYGMDEESLIYILAHERAHLKRKDHIQKTVAFLILCVYWFHPLVWLSYILFGRDIELACDEKAVLDMDKQDRKKYLLTLLKCTTSKRSVGGHPLAFGEIGLKERVIRMKQWKKPSIIFVAATFLVCIVVSVCFLTSPKIQETQKETAQTETDADSMVLEVRQASVKLSENTGADGTMIYYVDAKKIVFGGYFGLFIYDKDAGRIVQSLDLEYIGCNQTQGDDYCAIAVDKDGQKIYLNPLSQKKLYILDIESNTLKQRDYAESDIWSDDSLDLFYVENAKQVSYSSGGEEMVCILNEKDFTIGNCAYTECNRNELESKKEREYFSLFGQWQT